MISPVELVTIVPEYIFGVGKVIRDRLVKTDPLPPVPPNLTTNTQAWSTYFQVSSGSNSEEINEISCCTVAPIEVQ